jgi:hypothetical protein
LERDFIHAYYGKAAPAMEKIISSIYNRLDDDKNNKRIPDKSYFSRSFITEIFRLFTEAEKLAPEKVKAEIRSDAYNFAVNGIYAAKPFEREGISEEFGILLSKYISHTLADHAAAVNKAEKAGAKIPGPDRIIKKIWDLTRVEIKTDGLKDGEVPALLLELQKNPVAAIRKHMITDFTEKIPNGIRLPAMAFSGGEGPMYYKWKCEGKVAAWVRGNMTEVSKMQAEFSLAEKPSGEVILEIEGQDSDKMWCPNTRIKIMVNNNLIFEGPNGFIKHGWSKRKFKVAEDIISKGNNVIEIINTVNSDSRSAHWFMISEAKFTWK